MQLLWRTAWSILTKQKIELLDDLAIPLLSIYLKEMQSLYQINIFTPHVHHRITQEMKAI